MSNQTWMVEFYPTYASATLPDEAAAHSLRKWEGLTREALAKHGLVSAPIQPSAENCALCQHFLQDEPGRHTCFECPVTKLRGFPCDEATEIEIESPWHMWRSERNPWPMIELLREVCGED